MIIRAKAPVRFCDLGGWSDTKISGQGYVLNIALSLHTNVTLKVGNDKRISLESDDTNEFQEAKDIRELEYNSVLDLLKASLIRIGVYKGVKLSVSSDAPPASGLGTSAALGISVIGALTRYLNWPMLPYEIAKEAHAVETEELGQECGVQDQYAAVYGGVNFMEIDYPEARVHNLRLTSDMISELEDRLMLVYTGRSHFSSDIHKRVIAQYVNNNCKISSIINELKQCAIKGKNALLMKDFDEFAKAINTNWEAQQLLDSQISTAEVYKLENEVRKVGAIAFKLNGAGAGGTATILLHPEKRYLLRTTIEQMGMKVLPVKIDLTGLRVWEQV